MDKTFLKRRYYDMRMGGVTFAPAIQLANFSMILFLYAKEYIPFEIFAPLFGIGGMILLVYLGSKFRKIQQSTDLDMGFERAKSQGETLYQIMKALNDISPQDETFKTTMEYMRKISKGSV